MELGNVMLDTSGVSVTTDMTIGAYEGVGSLCWGLLTLLTLLTLQLCASEGGRCSIDAHRGV